RLEGDPRPPPPLPGSPRRLLRPLRRIAADLARSPVRRYCVAMPDAPARCPHVTTCPLFPLIRLTAVLAVWKTNYCDADYARCARHAAAARGEAVPVNLLPNGTLLRKPGDTGK